MKGEKGREVLSLKEDELEEDVMSFRQIEEDMVGIEARRKVNEEAVRAGDDYLVQELSLSKWRVCY